MTKSGGILGIDPGETNIKAVWMDEDGAVLRKETRRTEDSVPAGAWKEEIPALIADHPGIIGIAAPGLASLEAVSQTPVKCSSKRSKYILLKWNGCGRVSRSNCSSCGGRMGWSDRRGGVCEGRK